MSKKTISEALTQEQAQEMGNLIGNLMTRIPFCEEARAHFNPAYFSIMGKPYTGQAIDLEVLSRKIVASFKRRAKKAGFDPVKAKAGNPPVADPINQLASALTRQVMLVILDDMVNERLALIGITPENREAYDLFVQVQRDVTGPKPDGSVKEEDLPALADELVGEFKARWARRTERSLSE